MQVVNIRLFRLKPNDVDSEPTRHTQFSCLLGFNAFFYADVNTETGAEFHKKIQLVNFMRHRNMFNYATVRLLTDLSIS